MTPFLGRSLAVGLVAALAVLLGNGLVSYWNIRTLFANVQAVTRTQEALAQLQDVLSTLQDAETGQRGYLLTGRPEYLRPYRQAVKRMDQAVNRLRDLTARTTPSQQERLDLLVRLKDDKLRELRQTIDLHDAGQHSRALQVVRSDYGQERMDDIRRVIGAMRAEENRLLEQRGEESRARLRFTLASLAAATALSTALLLAVAALVWREVASRAALYRTRSRLAAIVESSDDAIIGKTMDGTIISWNKGAERLYGYTEADVLGRNIALLIPPDHPDELTEIMERLRRGEHIAPYETVRVDKEGRRVDVSLAISPIRDVDGRIIGASAIARDIRERKRAEEEVRRLAENLEARVRERTAQLEEVNQQLEAFSYTISHDLRAPVRNIQGLGQALLEDYADRLDPEGQDYVRRLVRAGRSIEGLIQDLLAYSRLSRADLRLQPVDYAVVLQEVLTGLRQEIEEHQAEVIVEGALPTVLAHRSTLVQVVANLVGNALKFVAPGTTPRVRIWARSGSGSVVRLWVEDNGIGIAPQHHERIFHVFERLHGEDRFPGTGIGLAIVRKGVERMGGRAGVESKVAGGSRFWIDLQGAGERA